MHVVFRSATLLLGSLTVALLASSACDSSPQVKDGESDSNGSDKGTGGERSDFELPNGLGGEDGNGQGGQDSRGEPKVITELPPGFTPGAADPTDEDAPTPRGGYMLVGPLEEIGDFEQAECANILRGITRDFTTAHADFGDERADGPGFVLSTLNENRKPVLTDDENINTEIVALEDWYTTIDTVNEAYVMDLWLEPVGDTFVFDSGLYFPVDSVGTEFYESHDDMDHNFHFTTELHTSFEYEGGEYFTFRGDDDVWVFINGQLAVDLGGIHGPEQGSVDLDEEAETLGLTIGGVYELDLFHAERKVSGSNFRIETTLNFSGCGEILPTDVVK